MNIYTSSFSIARKLDESKFFVVSIARFSPRWHTGYTCFEFAPSATLLKQYKEDLRNDHYTNRYIKQVLEPINVYAVFQHLAKMAGTRDIVLCCYEPPFEFCHRRILARYVKEHFGYQIEEYYA